MALVEAKDVEGHGDVNESRYCQTLLKDANLNVSVKAVSCSSSHDFANKVPASRDERGRCDAPIKGRRNTICVKTRQK